MLQKNRFDYKLFLNAIVTLALPIAMQNLLSTTASMVDTIMIGSQGELAVAAVGTCSQISSLFYSCYTGLIAGALLFFSQYWGGHDFQGINRTFGLSMVSTLLIALIFSGISVIFPEVFLRIYTDKETIVQAAVPYLRIVGFSFPISTLAWLLSFFLRSTERVKAPLFSSIAALLVNFVLNWLLIYGRFGLPKMGAAGAAVGTLVSSIVNFILMLIIVLRDQKSVRLHIRQMFDWNRDFLRIYFAKCFPLLCNDLFYGIGQMLINVVIGRQSEAAIAAMATFRVLEGFVFAFFGGLADASSVVVGREVGAGRHMKAYQYVKGFAILMPAITFCIIAVGCLFQGPLLSLFGLSPEGMEYGKYMLLIYLAAGTIRTCNYIMNGCYRAAGDPVFGTVLEIVCLFTISVPATWVAGMVLQLPFLAVFAFVYTDEIIRLIFEIHRTRSCKWIKPVTEEGRTSLEAFHQELHAMRARK